MDRSSSMAVQSLDAKSNLHIALLEGETRDVLACDGQNSLRLKQAMWLNP